MNGKRVLNWKPSPKDTRDVPFAKAAFLGAAQAASTLPKRVDMRAFCSPVEDQGELGSCTAQALVGACELLQMRRNAGLLPCELSRLFAYYNGRRAMGVTYVRQDSGCYIRTVIKAAARVGICDESVWPYDVSAFAKKPPVAAYAEATEWQLTGYASLTDRNAAGTLQNIRKTLAAGFPVAFGFNVYPSLMTQQTAVSGIAPIPRRDEISEGGHAVLESGDTAKTGWFSGVVPYLFAHRERGAG